MRTLNTRAINARKVPADLHGRFKSLCALENISIQDKVVELIREYVERQERKVKK